MARQLTIELVGESAKAEQAFRNVGDASERMASDVNDSADRTHKSLDDVGEGFDTGEQRIVGFRDAITGTSDVMKGFREGDIVGVATGFADLASSVANFIVPALQRLGAMLGLSTGATQAASVANTTFGASLTAALGPIALVVAAIAGIIAIGVLIVKNWDTIKDAAAKVWEFIQTGWDKLLGFFGSIPGKLGALGGTLVDILTWPYRTAFNAIADLWNHTVGALAFKVPDWVPAIGGKGWEVPDIPKFHSGGIVPGTPGTEVPIIALAGERITAVGQQPPTSNLTIYAQTNASAKEIADEISWSAKVSGF